MKQLILIASLIIFSNQENVTLKPDSDSRSKESLPNNRYSIYFEQFFQDSITIKYNKQVVFKKYVKTINRIEAARVVCRIDKIKNNEPIIISINNKEYILNPKRGYRYYYLTKLNSKMAATYSNVLRDYN